MSEEEVPAGRIAVLGGTDWTDQAFARLWIKRLGAVGRDVLVMVDDDPFDLQRVVLRQCKCSGVPVVMFHLPTTSGRGAVQARQARDGKMLELAGTVFVFGALAANRMVTVLAAAEESGLRVWQKRMGKICAEPEWIVLASKVGMKL